MLKSAVVSALTLTCRQYGHSLLDRVRGEKWLIGGSFYNLAYPITAGFFWQNPRAAFLTSSDPRISSSTVKARTTALETAALPGVLLCRGALPYDARLL